MTQTTLEQVNDPPDHLPRIPQILLELAVIDASLEAHRRCLATLERIAADLAKIKTEAL